MRKFVDDLPMLCSPPACPTTGKYLPTAVPDVKKYTDTSVTPSRDIAADEYVIGLVQYRTSFSLRPAAHPGARLRPARDTRQRRREPALPADQREPGPDQADTPVLINGVQASA